MLCSIPTGKSGSNWLDRLRSSKGFPTGDNLDLDHFLTNSNPSDSPLTNASNSPNSNAESTHSNDKQLQNPEPPPPEVISGEPAGDKEWFGFSRSEVTVIDTSCQVWKADKLIFRRKNIWKVKDKKGKSRTFGRKKRKAPPPPSDDNNGGFCNKKQKISSSELRSLTETRGRECGSPMNHGQKAPGDKEEQACNETAEDLTQVLRKRFPVSRLPRKSGKESTSVVLIKTIPTGKKSGAKNRLKETHKA
ncbi:hypothetical protein COLO4_14368 [Corchorus olitorius]|uniref:Uncharacterized protein n=1 Tax=Corchorus olitorius TaxID=93759 RepID=A0A1R3JSC9_9ROSI|nr:hypothetical protein COLO4_14368 [Corchorus olitorius]